MKFPNVVTVAQLAGFDEVIDVRSPAEFAEDHVPGAINLKNFARLAEAQVLRPAKLEGASLRQMAAQLIADAQP